MQIRNSTDRSLKVRGAGNKLTLETHENTDKIGDLAEIQVLEASDSDLQLRLTRRGGTRAGGGAGSTYDGGTGEDDDPAANTDGDGGDSIGGNRTGHGWRHGVEIANSTGGELRLRIERTLPDGKALRIVGPPELFDVTEDDGGICVTLRSR